MCRCKLLTKNDNNLMVELRQCRLWHQMNLGGEDKCGWADKSEKKTGYHSHRLSGYNEGHIMPLSYDLRMDTCYRRKGRTGLVIDQDVLCSITSQYTAHKALIGLFAA